MHYFLRFTFGIKLYMFRTLSIIGIFSLYTQQYIQACWQLSSRIRTELRISILILLASCQQTCMTYTIAVCTVKTPDDGQRNCPKHVEFCSKNKFENSVDIVGFIIKIYYDARSPERQM